jgi:tRNA1(Val) A37 N6-methylase TrmN6
MTQLWTEDTVLDGRVRLRQAKDGYRAGMDAALLAAACDARDGERVIDVGCGVGGAMLAAAARRPGARFVGVERDPAALDLARQNIVLNGWQDRVEAIEADVALPFSRLGLKPFDAAISNPPFFDDAGAIRGPADSRKGAWIADDGLAAWVGFLLKSVREGGTITVIHRADRLADLLALLGAKAGSFRIRPIAPFADQPAKRVIVRAIKTGKAPLILLPPLVLHEAGGGNSAAAEGILRAQNELGWA